MRALLLAALLLATPVAAAGWFVALPAPAGEGVACGARACFPLLPGESVVRVAGGSVFELRAADGSALGVGSACESALVDIPAGAVLLVVEPGGCA